MRQLRWVVSFIVVIMILFNCGKNKPLPTAYSDIFGDKEGIIADTLLVQPIGTEKFFSRLMNTVSSPNLLLGNYRQYHSVIYLKFGNLPDSVYFHSATLLLKRNATDSSLGIPQNQFICKFYFSEEEWDENTDPELYLEKLPFTVSPFHTASIVTDTTNQIQIEFDTLAVAHWADSTSGIINNGFWIDSPDAEFIDSFYSLNNSDQSSLPRLQIIHSDLDSIGVKRDTSIVYATSDAFLILNDAKSLDLSEELFYIGKGLAFRSFLKFNLSEFDSTMHINRAQLTITTNKAYSLRNAADAIDCRIYRVEGESWAKNEVNENPSTGIYSGTLSDSILTFDVTPTVQAWLDHKYHNYGFMVRAADEGLTLSRVAFYSSKSQFDFQPKLYLYYTLPPKQTL